MKTKTIKVCNATYVDVTCSENDSADINCGGPLTLGYEFYVNPDVDDNDLYDFIRKCLDENNLPFISMSLTSKIDFPVKSLWTKEEISEYIKNNPV